VRAYETTGHVPRFNQGGQNSVVLLQNFTSSAVAGDAYFWSTGGALLATQPFSLNPRATQAIILSTIPALAGQSGSVTVTHNGPHGGVVGKAVSVDAFAGFAFDSPMSTRLR
jgi:hypothetical protein